jgi:hypothetical protein
MSSFRLRLTKEDSTGDIQLLKGYVSVLRVSPFTSNTIVGVEATDNPGYYDFEDVQTGVLYQRWNGTSLSNLTMDKSFSGSAGQVVIGSSGTTVASQSGNVVRLIPSATSDLAGKVYKEISDAITYCKSIADIDTRMTIQIEGDGVGGDVETDFNVLPATAGVGTLAKWISYSGLNKSMTLAVVAETATYTGELDDEGNKVKITNLRINQTAQSITTTFENIDFSGCSFNADFPNGSFENFYSFVNCNFSDCVNGSATPPLAFDSGCSGVFGNQLLAGLIVGTDTPLTVVSGSGYVTPQRLLGVSTTVALSTGTLDLNITNGNRYNVTGTGASGNGLYSIMSTGWTAGSEITLKFASACILRYQFAAGGLTLKNGVERETLAGETVKFQYDGTYWLEIIGGNPNGRILGVADQSIATVGFGLIALTLGNAFTITGTGGVYGFNLMGWTVNSIITVTVVSVQTIYNDAGGANYNLNLIGAVNRTTTSNEVIRFKLNSSSKWVEF